MKISDAGLALIRRFEGCKLEAYQDSAGIWSIGFGHTLGVCRGDRCTQEQADAKLMEDSHRAENCLDKCVTAELTQGEYDGLCALIYNIGCGAFRGSTLLRYINDGRMDDAAEQFQRWNHAGGRTIDGLTARRKAEREMFES